MSSPNAPGPVSPSATSRRHRPVLRRNRAHRPSLLKAPDFDVVEELGLEAGSMTLVDGALAARIREVVGEGREVSGGTVANTAAGVASLGGSPRVRRRGRERRPRRALRNRPRVRRRAGRARASPARRRRDDRNRRVLRHRHPRQRAHDGHDPRRLRPVARLGPRVLDDRGLRARLLRRLSARLPRTRRRSSSRILHLAGQAGTQAARSASRTRSSSTATTTDSSSSSSGSTSSSPTRRRRWA